MIKLICLTVELFFSFAGVSQPGLNTDRPFIEEKTSSVLILPIQNASGEKWKELKERQVEKSESDLRKAFEKKGVVVLSKESALEVAAEAKIDLSDEENWKRATFLQLGKAAGAKYVFFGVIQSTESAERERALFKDLEGKCEVKIWLLNCQTDEVILSAKVFTGRSGGFRISDGKGSSRQVQAAANGFMNGLKDFLKTLGKAD